jgi:hypothetical protein
MKGSPILSDTDAACGITSALFRLISSSSLHLPSFLSTSPTPQPIVPIAILRRARLSYMNHGEVENVPCEAPFPDGAENVTLRRDPEDPSSFIGTVPEDHPCYKSIITVSNPALLSEGPWSNEKVKSFSVAFPGSQFPSEALSFDFQKDIGWSHDRRALDYRGTATEFIGFNGELLDDCVEAKPEKFQVTQKLVLDPHFASFMTDEESERFNESNVSDVIGETVSCAHHRQMAPSCLGSMDKPYDWMAFRRRELTCIVNCQ